MPFVINRARDLCLPLVLLFVYDADVLTTILWKKIYSKCMLESLGLGPSILIFVHVTQ